MNSRRLSAYILFLIVTIIAAVAGVVIKFTLGGISTLPFLTYRFALSSVVALVSLFIYKGIPKRKDVLLELVVFSFITSTLALGLLFLGLEKTTVLEMSIITAIGPLAVAVAGTIYLKEHITNQEKIGMAIALFGTLVILVEPILRLHDGKPQVAGNLLIFAYLLTTVISAVLGKRLLQKGVSPLAMTNSIFIVGFLTITPIAAFAYGLPKLIQTVSGLSLPYQLGVIFMAFISGNLAYFLANKAQKTIEISESALFSYLIPIFTAPLAIFFLGEKITPVFIAASVVTLIGVGIAEYKKRGR